jgi:hypothetical protein
MDVVTDAVDRVRRPMGIDQQTMLEMVEGALEALGERQSTWRPAEVVRELAAQVPTHVTVEPDQLCGFLQELADHVTVTRCVDLSPPILAGAVLRRDGRPISEAAVDRALTTQAILDEEEQILEWAERQHQFGAIIDTRPRDLDIDVLSPGQADACRAAAGMAPLELIVGPAGSGKTTALAPAVHYLQERGQVVFGVAPTAAAAEVLATEPAMPADTLDKLLYEHSRPDRAPEAVYDLPRGATVIVDEAGTVSTPKLAAPRWPISPTGGHGGWSWWGILASSPPWAAAACSATSSTPMALLNSTTSTASPTIGNATPPDASAEAK